MQFEHDRRRSADGLGYRAKIGLLVPATNTICQPECEDMKPFGVTNHVARMRPVPRGAENGDMDAYRVSLNQDTSNIKDAISSVIHCRPDLIVLGHSIDTFRGGADGALGLKRELEDYAGGVPVILPSLAFLAALRALGFSPFTNRKLAILSPYWPPADDQVRAFFNGAGYEVGRIIGLKCPGAVAIAETPAATVIGALQQLATDRPDVIIEPGTNLPFATIAAAASAWLDTPVLSCNVATYWHALRTLGIADKSARHGPLFRDH
jgi:maleate isomerase